MSRTDSAPGSRERRAAVMGSPIAHTLSPALHRAAYDGLGLQSWRYDAVEVDADALPGAIGALGPEWVGVSLTMPLKHAVLPLLDEVSDLARAVGAVNTLTLTEGRRRGDNTDVEGIVVALREAGVERVGEAVVLGGGATGASALAALRELGAFAPTLVVRSPQRAAEALEAAARLGVRPLVWPWAEVADVLSGADVVISTVPPGVADRLATPATTGRGVLLDVVYNPWPTPYALAWEAAGGTVVAGLEMLVHQAVAQVRAWTGRVPDAAAMRAAGRAALLAQATADRKGH
jgi:shikimate dehydrogenase